MKVLFSWISICMLAFGLSTACIEYPVERPQEDYDRVMRKIAEQDAAAASSNDPHAAAKSSYGTYCATCHGQDGKANGAAAQAMNPKPRNLTLATWQGGVDDAHITKVLKEGGQSVGLSATMAAWGAVLSDEQIAGIVAYIRSMKE